MDKRTGWLAALEVGSLVAVAGRYGRALDGVAKVEKITPSGRITVGTQEYNADGWERGGSSFVHRHLLEATPERVETVKRSRIARVLTDLVDSNRESLERASVDLLVAAVVAVEKVIEAGKEKP